MGQYYMLTNIDKLQVILPWNMSGTMLTFNEWFTGAKLVEQLENLGKKTMLAMSLLKIKPIHGQELVPPPNPMFGSWAGDRIVLIGDYSDVPPPTLTPAEVQDLESRNMNLYTLASDFYLKLDYLSFLQNKASLKSYLTQGGVIQNPYHIILNLDTEEYLDPRVFHPHMVSVDEWSMGSNGILKGLYRMLFWSTGSGGGDVDELKRGEWAGCHLEIVEKSQFEDDLFGWINVSQKSIDKLETCGYGIE